MMSSATEDDISQLLSMRMNPLVEHENFSALADQQTNIPIWFPNILDFNYILPTSDRIRTVLSQLATTGC